MSLDTKVGFLQTVRRALGRPADQRRQPPPGLFAESPSEESRGLLEGIAARGPAGQRALIETLRRAAEPIGLEVHVAASVKEAAAAIADTVAGFPTEWGGPRQVCAWDHPLIDALALPSALAGQEIPVVSSRSFFRQRSDGISGEERAALRRGMVDSFVGVTAADFCVADTATLVLRTRPGQPRSVSLIPSLHIAVIPADRILADLKELYAVLRWGHPGQPAELTNCMTFITGPSKTADIEATLVHGAHGPKAVCLFVIAEQSA